MHATCCLEVTVRFNKPHLQGQVINRSSGPTATDYVRVEHDALRLSVNFCNANGRVLQQLNFNSNDVVEYNCENVCSPVGESIRKL